MQNWVRANMQQADEIIFTLQRLNVGTKDLITIQWLTDTLVSRLREELKEPMTMETVKLISQVVECKLRRGMKIESSG